VVFKLGVEVGVEESIVNASPDHNSDQLFKSNLTFCVVCVFNLQFEKSVFLRRVVHSQSTLKHHHANATRGHFFNKLCTRHCLGFFK
jgi:hypothetical protein